ncbi:3-oxoacyl-ACP synthase III family protein [Streptomyces avidinii]|uniref:3-oxoacyl-[acyl-carrier-protein] synthase-3 n=1 Tax=Streptomyces avidinii TaxID=1895 RepID=A0ABS4LFU8_STRAV|nr:3-oxoacyl-[acyl-carrier-protein] synthase III C-terminal domain-containing protein [Streptomyces avidinii]MBP2040992.1 3-oxoacyl-[acyl-carrier-protein] synthase-3 [Streptomyces avidinii]GGZ05449.1 3-oxoacyl-ACP synthase [Streptomyces avidinii]
MSATAYSRIEALGVYLPAAVQTTDQLSALVPGLGEVDIEKITGIAERRVHDPEPAAGEDSFGMALSAARDALESSRYRAEDLDIVISASITRFKDGNRFTFEPSFAAMLAKELGARSAIHFDVSNACAGMMTGVWLLDRMIRSGAVRRGLVVSGEQATRVAQTAAREMTDSYDPQFASLSVGDSASAVVLDVSTDAADRIHYIELMTCSEYSHLCMGMPSDRTPGIALYTDNKKMHNRDRLKLWPRFHGDFLAKRGQTFAGEEFDYVIQHQVGTRFIDYVNQTAEAEFAAPMPPSLAVVERYGNTATTSHFLTLCEHLRAGGARPGAKYLMVPAASGVVTGALSATLTNVGV